MSAKKENFLELLKKYDLEGNADVNFRDRELNPGIFLVPLIEKEDEEVEFPFEFLFELDCLLRKKRTIFSKWLWKRKLLKPKKIKGKKYLRCFCFKITSPITITKLHARIEARRFHNELANLCYE